MKKEKFTPGPWAVDVWEFDKADPKRKELVIKNDKNKLAVISWDEGIENPYTIPDEQAQANARLIAAAPAMFELLRDMLGDPTDKENETNVGNYWKKEIEKVLENIM